MTDITDTVTTRLLAGDNPFTIARDTGCTTAKLSELDHDGDSSLDNEVAVILPGYVADDGNAEVDYPDAESAAEAAQEYVDGGAWGETESTAWITVYVWREALVLDPDTGEVEEIQVGRDSHTATIEPDEPDCSADEHDWQSPHEVVGGIEENPGVWGHGGGVVMTEVCRHCGAYRVTDTWAQNMSTGEQGLTSVEYREADERSLTWISDSLLGDAEQTLVDDL
jgi:hypothetical protein